MLNAFVLMAGRHHEPLACSETIFHHPNTLSASGCRFIRHIEEITQSRKYSAQGMLYPHTIQMPPHHLGQGDGAILRFHFPNRLLYRVQEKRRPCGIVLRIGVELRDLRREKLA
jgi:hypothetical protein